MPRSVVITPVLMLVAGVITSVGLWIVLNQDAPRRGYSGDRGSDVGK